MDYNGMNDSELMQALEEAHCDGDTIKKFMQLKAQCQDREALELLSCYRCCLVRKMHEAQKPMDILDYLLHQFQKSKS